MFVCCCVQVVGVVVAVVVGSVVVVVVGSVQRGCRHPGRSRALQPVWRKRFVVVDSMFQCLALQSPRTVWTCWAPVCHGVGLVPSMCCHYLCTSLSVGG